MRGPKWDVVVNIDKRRETMGPDVAVDNKRLLLDIGLSVVNAVLTMWKGSNEL
jgi:hypothetical protein